MAGKVENPLTVLCVPDLIELDASIERGEALLNMYFPSGDGRMLSMPLCPPLILLHKYLIGRLRGGQRIKLLQQKLCTSIEDIDLIIKENISF